MTACTQAGMDSTSVYYTRRFILDQTVETPLYIIFIILLARTS